MKDRTHDEQVERWANFVKAYPKEWKREHTQFINSQIEMANSFYERLSKMPGGMEKIRQLRNLKQKVPDA